MTSAVLLQCVAGSEAHRRRLPSNVAMLKTNHRLFTEFGFVRKRTRTRRNTITSTSIGRRKKFSVVTRPNFWS